MRFYTLLTSCLLVLGVSSVFGQAPIRLAPALRSKQSQKEVAPASGGSPANPAATPASGQAGAAETVSKESDRLQKLRQLQFDRRPSAILKAWSTPPGAAKSDEAKPDQPEGEPSEAKPKEEITDPEAAKKAKEAEAARKALEAEVAALQRNVTLGNWDDVKTYLAGLPKDEAKAGYQQMLQSLGNGPPRQQPQSQAAQAAQQLWERNVFNTDDVLALARAAPHKLEKQHIQSLGGITRQVLEGGTVLQALVARLRHEAEKRAADAGLAKRQIAQVLFAAGQAVEAAAFLPDLDQATTDNDHEALNLLARYFMALHAKDKKPAQLEQAWTATQAALAASAPDAEKNEALSRAVELAPQVREQLGQTWLEDSFTQRPERGMEIIATIGTLASKGFETQPTNPDFRLKGLQLQKTATEALLRAAPERAADWRAGLNLLAKNWLKEAEFSHQRAQSTSMSHMLRQDPYGNIYYYDEEEMMRVQGGRGEQPQPIASGKILEIRPSEDWLKLIDDGIQPKFPIVFARLYLKVNEEDKAFPYIEQIATTQPERTRELVDEFLQVWTRNHNPNEARGRTHRYFFMFGFERRAEGIPLTRSKQDRNLDELAKLVDRLRALPGVELKEELLARAFTTCHSSAEVYRLEAIEKVFGAMDRLKPKTLAALVQQMRGNLAGVWRQPAVQEDKKTKRKPKDIEAEVLRGYTVARSVVDNAVEKFPDEWSLQLARAAVLLDETNYRQELAKSSDFSKNRADAIAQFRRAAELYAAQVGTLSQDEETSDVYDQWFYASLGAADIGHVDADKVPDLRQPPLIRDAIRSLPGEAAERHTAKFANSLFTRMSAVNPAVKFRYLRTGFEIVGDHKQAAEARKVFDYYKDLVTEIKLDAKIDGSDVVGHGQPFGVFVSLRHTREIERESGGFGRYLQNQNTSTSHYYNYGRPLENYRDKFQDAAREALKEHFEVLSVTFQDDKVTSKAVQEYGWRVTPYAYLLLKARGPQVDKLPPLKLDLDFLDTSGYVILPIESPAVPLDAAPEQGDPRPLQKLRITQTLDERQAADGKLVLEVKATAQGLVPDLDEILELDPEGFDITKTDDDGVSVSKFDPESDETVVVSERTWLVSMQAKSDLPTRPDTFRFGEPKLETGELTYQRYVDADLKEVDSTISLEQRYGEPSRRWLWTAAASVVIVAGMAVFVRRLTGRIRPQEQVGYRVPDPITPFTVLGLLRTIHQNNGLNDTGRQELLASIGRIERYYFGKDVADGEPDLGSIAHEWVQRAR